MIDLIINNLYNVRNNIEQTEVLVTSIKEKERVFKFSSVETKDHLYNICLLYTSPSPRD